MVESKLSFLPVKLPVAAMPRPPMPASRVCATPTPTASMSKATLGSAGAPVTFAVPDTVPPACKPGEKALASDSGTCASTASMSSVPAAVPETVAVPPPRPTTSLSMRVTPSATVMTEGAAIVALRPCTVTCPEASSTVVVPSAILT